MAEWAKIPTATFQNQVDCLSKMEECCGNKEGLAWRWDIQLAHMCYGQFAFNYKHF